MNVKHSKLLFAQSEILFLTSKLLLSIKTVVKGASGNFLKCLNPHYVCRLTSLHFASNPKYQITVEF